MQPLTYQELFNVTDPEQSEANLRQFSNIPVARFAVSDLGLFRSHLRGAQVAGTIFHRVSLIGQSAWKLYNGLV